jgi:hypothetical protein
VWSSMSEQLRTHSAHHFVCDTDNMLLAFKFTHRNCAVFRDDRWWTIAYEICTTIDYACTSSYFCGDEAILVYIVAARPWGMLRGHQEPGCGRRLVLSEYRFILFSLHQLNNSIFLYCFSLWTQQLSKYNSHLLCIMSVLKEVWLYKPKHVAHCHTIKTSKLSIHSKCEWDFDSCCVEMGKQWRNKS